METKLIRDKNLVKINKEKVWKENMQTKPKKRKRENCTERLKETELPNHKAELWMEKN
jgi:hypothetical protein